MSFKSALEKSLADVAENYNRVAEVLLAKFNELAKQLRDLTDQRCGFDLTILDQSIPGQTLYNIVLVVDNVPLNLDVVGLFSEEPFVRVGFDVPYPTKDQEGGNRGETIASPDDVEAYFERMASNRTSRLVLSLIEFNRKRGS
jgi:hypothetical protein